MPRMGSRLTTNPPRRTRIAGSVTPCPDAMRAQTPFLQASTHSLFLCEQRPLLSSQRSKGRRARLVPQGCGDRGHRTAHARSVPETAYHTRPVPEIAQKRWHNTLLGRYWRFHRRYHLRTRISYRSTQ
eukprot:3868440-Rhodomonas_salina.1